MMKDDNRLVNDVRFRDQFIYSMDIVQKFKEGEIAIIEENVFSM